EELVARLNALDRRADGEELDEAAHFLEIGRDTRQPLGVLMDRLLFHAFNGGMAAVGYEFRDALNLAAGEGPQAASQAANEAERIDAVPDDDVRRSPAFLGQTIDLISR